MQESISDLKTSVTTQPENVNARNNLGLSYFENKEYKQALLEFNKAIELDVANPTLFLNRGIVYYHMGEHTTAI